MAAAAAVLVATLALAASDDEPTSIVERAGSEIPTRNSGSAGPPEPTVQNRAASSSSRDAAVAGEPAATDVEPGETASTTTSAPRTATLAFTGDIIPHGAVVRQAAANAPGANSYDFAPMFARVEPYLSSVDVAICHLETPVSLTNNDVSGYPTFNAPRELVDAIAAAGYDGCSTASNHAMDRNVDGVTSTVTAFERRGLHQAGMARTSLEAAEPTLYDAGDLVVGHVSFTYGLNGFTPPADRPWLVDVIDPAAIEAKAAAARAAGADYVVLSLHWGDEYQSNPSADQTALANRLAAHPDIDLIIGHHAHVVQPASLIGDTPVVFGLGNFLSNQSGECCVVASQDGVIVEVTVTERPAGEFATALRFTPTWVDRGNYVIMPAAAFATERPDSSLSPLLLESWARTNATLTSMGAAIEPTERPAGG